mgnify:CR=1 FL=1
MRCNKNTTKYKARDSKEEIVLAGISIGVWIVESITIIVITICFDLLFLIYGRL